MPYGDTVTERSVTAEQWGRFLAGVFDEWVRHDVGEVYVQLFDAALANWYGEPPGLCVHAPTCGTALALEFNGDVYSCDHFVDPGHLLGNIGEEPLGALADSGAQRRFGLDKRDTLPACCRACSVLGACHGGCPKDRFVAAPDGGPGLNYLCAGFKAFFAHVDEPDAHHVRAAARRARPVGDRRALSGRAAGGGMGHSSQTPVSALIVPRAIAFIMSS